MIQLFAFTSFPKVPSIKLLELPAGEMANSLLCRGSSMGLDGLYEDVNLLSGDVGLREVLVRMVDGSNGTDISNRKSWSMLIIGRSVGFEQVIFQDGLAQLYSRETPFRGKLNSKGGGLGIIKLAKGSNNILLGEDRRIVNFDNVGTTNLIAGGLVGGEEFGSTALGLDGGEECTIVEIISGNSHTKRGILAGYLKCASQSVGERARTEVKFSHSGLIGLRRKGLTILGALQVNDIGRDRVNREVIHTFIKASMLGSLHMTGFRVIPDNILGGIREETQEGAFAGIRPELGFAFARRMNPDMTTKSAKGREVILLGSGHGIGGVCLILRGQ